VTLSSLATADMTNRLRRFQVYWRLQQPAHAACFACTCRVRCSLCWLHSDPSLRVQGLFPCGEGAGYAGGIVSAAVDGVRCARAILKGVDNEADTAFEDRQPTREQIRY
jgi:uncharacterized FAD-dependent dehydrogenase